MDGDDGPHPTIEEVLACQFSSWYPTFSNLAEAASGASSSSSVSVAAAEEEKEKEDEPPPPPPTTTTTVRYPRRSNVTIQSVVISHHDIPQKEFRDFLLSDGVKLPACATKLSSCATMNVVKRVEDLDDDSDNDDDDDDDDDTGDEKNDDNEDDDDDDDDDDVIFEFPQLTQQIHDVIRTLGGAVMPKLNWSSPKDATWINEGTMKCQTPGDVYLLLKSSDFCLHDVLGQSFQHCRRRELSRTSRNSTHDHNGNVHDDDHDDKTHAHAVPLPPPKLQIVLRKWRPNLHPSKEFRCFVRDHELIAISQRHHSQHYPHLMNDWKQLRDCIDDFYEDVVYKRFQYYPTFNDQDEDGSGITTTATCTTISNFVFDVYVDQKDRVWIIDFNPWSSTTDSLLFDWTELRTMDICDYDDGDDEDGLPKMKVVQTSRQVRQDPLSSYRAPIDAVELASMTHGDSKEFETFMKKCQQQIDDGDGW